MFANRTPADILLKDELDALQVRFPNFKVGLYDASVAINSSGDTSGTPCQVLYTVDSVPAGATWSGPTGHVSKEMIASFLPPPQPEAGRHKLLVCGPPPMVASVSFLRGRRIACDSNKKRPYIVDLRSKEEPL